MKLRKAAKIKLNLSVAEVLPTMRAYTQAFNFVAEIGFEQKEKNGVRLHHLTYYQLRELTSLPAELTISARMKATEALKAAFTKMKKKPRPKDPNKLARPQKCPQSKLCSIRYSKNAYSLFLKKKEASLLLLGGRKRCSFDIPAYYADLFQSWKYTSADLVIHNKKWVYLHITFEKEIEDTQPNGTYVGIDRGINNLAVVSNNQFYGGGKVKYLVQKQRTLRKKLQKKGTKSAKRHLVRLRKREQRFRADINHQISKGIIERLNPGDTIVLEGLTGIRNKRLRKPQRTLINGWSYFQLAQFITYKAMAKGIRVIYIDARYTSQRCSKCGHTCKSNRKEHSFSCKECGFRLNADLNASRNIVVKALESYTLSNGALVNEPIATPPSVAVANHQSCADSN
jgi:putative transposase